MQRRYPSGKSRQYVRCHRNSNVEVGYLGEKREVDLADRADAYSRFMELQGATKPSAMKTDGVELAAEYGNLTLLDTLNAIVTGKHALSIDYRLAPDDDAKKALVDGVIADYRNAAKKVLVKEFPDLIGSGPRRPAAPTASSPPRPATGTAPKPPSVTAPAFTFDPATNKVVPR